MKTVMITGANGFLGGKTIRKLVEKANFKIIALARDTNSVDEMLLREEITNNSYISIFNNEEIFNCFNFEDINAVVHFAFSRNGKSNQEIANSILFSKRLFKILRKNNVNNIINISTQGIYGDCESIRKTNIEASPNTIYSMAKYSTEVILDLLYETSNLNYTNLRLDNVIQSQNFVKSICKTAKHTSVINLVGGNQVFSYIDCEDVATAILSILESIDSNTHWQTKYNVGPSYMRYKLLEIANYVSDICVEHNYPKPVINFEKKDDIKLWAGLDSSQFMKDFSWIPRYSIKEMIERIFETV